MPYPVLASYLSDAAKPGFRSPRTYFIEIAAQIDAAFEAGSIINPEYVAAKDTFNRALDKADHAIKEAHWYGEWRHMNENQQKFGHMFGILYLHSVPGLIKRAEKFKLSGTNFPYHDAMMALLNEVAPLSAKMDFLKKNVVKRQPKPVEDWVEGYHPPKVSTDAQKRIVAMLEEVTVSSHQQLVSDLKDNMWRYVAEFRKELADNPKAKPYDFFCKGKTYPNHEGYECAMFSLDHTDAETEARFLKNATRTADDYRMHFVHKNFRKIASIVEGKGNISSMKTVGYTMSLIGMTGSFEFRFTDGSSFIAINQVVQSYSVYNKPFLRFPLNFTAVVMPSGKKMAQPSEKRMNEIFVKG